MLGVVGAGLIEPGGDGTRLAHEHGGQHVAQLVLGLRPVVAIRRATLAGSSRVTGLVGTTGITGTTGSITGLGRVAPAVLHRGGTGGGRDEATHPFG